MQAASDKDCMFADSFCSTVGPGEHNLRYEPLFCLISTLFKSYGRKSTLIWTLSSPTGVRSVTSTLSLFL
ncbi:hypothetical protein [Pontibacter diazotrophicus]|uniref:hypothetical protein n=1 Tax=Pontibacter diazotrophicus TaxID=1400979 RepID=UPI0011C07C4D|nr:hypothetical protein [Pontibacter diazotrophicus]